jgi:hypothetical protein
MFAVKILALGLVILVILSDEAWAYLDFSIGSFLVQGALGAVAGACVVVGNYWRSIKRLFGFMPPQSHNGMAISEKRRSSLDDIKEEKF